jgi:threonine dehydratase
MTSGAAPVATPVVTGWRCAVCDTPVGIEQALVWRCPNARGSERHELQVQRSMAPLRAVDDPNPFVSFRRYLAWDAFAAAHGFSDDERVAEIHRLDAAVSALSGVGFAWTPFGRSDGLSDALGFDDDGGVWVKDETGGAAGSHKIRHLVTAALHVLTAERAGLVPWTEVAGRPPLVIASCGNAALAAATIAAAIDWPITVFVPVWANEAVVAQLQALRATVVQCPRRDSDPPGDPCVHRFREAVAAGGLPFAVQGPENAWCLDGGRTIGWELALQLERQHPAPLDRLFVQVGGGALAACAWQGAADQGAIPRLHAVQSEGCAPLAAAWECVHGLGGPTSAVRQWASCMVPWPVVPESLADGILDDETYDWIPVVHGMARSHGSPIVVDESTIERAWRLGRDATGIDVSATGTAGLAGLLASRGEIADDENVVVIFSGVQR